MSVEEFVHHSNVFPLVYQNKTNLRLEELIAKKSWILEFSVQQNADCVTWLSATNYITET